MSFSRKVDQGYLSFARGLVTEINPLSTPEDLQGTTSDELNMIVDTDGMIRVRRAGFELIPNLSEAVQGTVLDARFWRKGSCYVVCSYDPTPSPETNEYNCTVTMVDESGQANKNRQFTIKVHVQDFVLPSLAFLRTKCLVTFGARPVLFTRESSGEFTIQYVNLFVRDFKLVDDDSTLTQRKGVLSSEHKYNLLNAGWYQQRRLIGTNTLSDPIAAFFAGRAQYPSNADVAYLGDITDTNGDLRFDPTAFDSVNVGATEAPRGHYVYDIRDIDRQARVITPSLDGQPSNTLTLLVEKGSDPITGFPAEPGVPIDDFHPERPPGIQIP
jgi:hypothetical protein